MNTLLRRRAMIASGGGEPPTPPEYITEADFIQSMLGYWISGVSTRAGVMVPIVDNTTFHGTIKCISPTVKVGVQLWDATQATPSPDSSSPSSNGTISTGKTTWDSGWITNGNTKTFDYTRNKNNTTGTATSSGPPVKVAFVFTYVSGNTGMPTLNEIKSAIELVFYPQ